MPYCGECGNKCDVVTVDNGIGPYEFWGQKLIDRDIGIESACCNAEAFENEDLTIEMDVSEFMADMAAVEADYRYDVERYRKIEEKI